jgi:hypothetical protein
MAGKLARGRVKIVVKGAKMHLKTKDAASFAIKNHQICKEELLVAWEVGVDGRWSSDGWLKRSDGWIVMDMTLNNNKNKSLSVLSRKKTWQYFSLKELVIFLH